MDFREMSRAARKSFIGQRSQVTGDGNPGHPECGLETTCLTLPAILLEADPTCGSFWTLAGDPSGHRNLRRIGKSFSKVKPREMLALWCEWRPGDMRSGPVFRASRQQAPRSWEASPSLWERFTQVYGPASLITGCRHCIFHQVKVCVKPASGKSFSSVFPAAFAHFLSVYHVLIILTTSQTFSLLLSLLWRPVNSDI